jgi:hypothetical protein
MPTKCTICPLPNYKEIVGLLKEGAPISTTANRYGLSAYALGRCFREHTSFDPLSSSALLLEIKQQEKALKVLLKTKSEGSMEVKRVRDHIRALRDDYRKAELVKGGDRGSVRPEDPETWPAWLGEFLIRYFDLLLDQADYKRARSAARDADAAVHAIGIRGGQQIQPAQVQETVQQ